MRRRLQASWSADLLAAVHVGVQHTQDVLEPSIADERHSACLPTATSCLELDTAQTERFRKDLSQSYVVRRWLADWVVLGGGGGGSTWELTPSSVPLQPMLIAQQWREPRE